jgi:hypothetical protein
MSDNFRLPNAAALVAERQECRMMGLKAGLYFEIKKMGIEAKFPMTMSKPDAEPDELRMLQDWAAQDGWLVECTDKKLLLSPQPVAPPAEKQ